MSLLPLILAALTVLQTGPGPGPGGPRGPGGGPGGPGGQGGPALDIDRFIQRVIETVGATPEQAKQLEAIAEEHRKGAEAARAGREETMREHAAELQTLREQAGEAQRAGDSEKANQVHEQMRALMGGATMDLMRQTRDKIAAILTQEQRVKFEEMTRQMRQRWGAEAGGPGGGQMGDVNIYRFMERVIQEVQATEDQRKQFRQIAAGHIEAVKAAEAKAVVAREENRQELEDLHRQAREARRANKPEEVKAIEEKIRAIMGAPMQDVFKATRDKIAATLTDEQKPKFEALVKQWQDRAGQRLRQAGPGPRGPGDRPRDGQGPRGPGERMRRGGPGGPPPGTPPPPPPAQGGDV